jgi:hypothetical protein
VLLDDQKTCEDNCLKRIKTDANWCFEEMKRAYPEIFAIQESASSALAYKHEQLRVQKECDEHAPVLDSYFRDRAPPARIPPSLLSPLQAVPHRTPSPKREASSLMPHQRV